MARKRSRRRTSLWRWLMVWSVLVTGIGWAIGLAIFADRVPKTPSIVVRSTDAVVVLTGGSERLAEGLRLLAANRGRKLFVSGVYRGVDVDEIIRVSRRGSAFAERIMLGHEADDTLGNARETARWMESEGYRSLLLVTSSYHMPRSLFEFRHEMPEIDIVPHPVFADSVRIREWWRWRGTTLLVAREYTKYLLARLRAAIAPPVLTLLRES